MREAVCVGGGGIHRAGWKKNQMHPYKITTPVSKIILEMLAPLPPT
jgi:hypothetical protein